MESTLKIDFIYDTRYSVSIELGRTRLSTLTSNTEAVNSFFNGISSERYPTKLKAEVALQREIMKDHFPEMNRINQNVGVVNNY